MDTELTKLADNLAGQIKDHGNKKVTVLDFTDLDGNTSEIGKYVAEQLTVDFVMNKRDFSVLDRANLKRIMEEHQLTTSGLVDPENAKKLGMFAGVDAMIFGKIVPAVNKVNLTTTIVTTDKAEIIGGGKVVFTNDSTVQQLITTPAPNIKVSAGAGTAADISDDKPKVVKTFGNFVVELQSLKILKTGQYLLTMTLTNRSPKDSFWVALDKTSILSEDGYVFGNSTATGLVSPQLLMPGSFYPATEIKPGDSTTATLAISSSQGRPPSPGVCTLQLQFYLANDYDFGSRSPKLSSTPNLVTKFEAK